MHEHRFYEDGLVTVGESTLQRRAGSSRTVDVAAQVKVLDAYERQTWQRKIPVPAFAAGVAAATFRTAGGLTADELQERDRPRYEDYGGPVYPDGLYEMTPECAAKFERARIGHRHGAMRRDYLIPDDERERLLDEFHAAFDAWKLTPGYRDYLARVDYLTARDAQFRYTGRGRQDKSLLASLLTALEPERIAA